MTTGPKVEEFEEKFARLIQAKYAVAVANVIKTLQRIVNVVTNIFQIFLKGVKNEKANVNYFE